MASKPRRTESDAAKFILPPGAPESHPYFETTVQEAARDIPLAPKKPKRYNGEWEDCAARTDGREPFMMGE
jgi:hypothetical protein